MLRIFLTHSRAAAAATILFLSSTFLAGAQDEPQSELLVSIHDQQMALVQNGEVLAKYPISTSKFGVGDAHGSYKTPLGRLKITEKYGDSLASGAVMKGRNATGEIIKVNAPGRDPIVTRILWLEGLEEQNRNAHARAIYIHGTPEEKNIGKPVSWGCIRMRSRDVVELYNQVPVGTEVTIIPDRLPRMQKADPSRPPTLLVNREPVKPTPAAAMPVVSTPSSTVKGEFVSTPLFSRESGTKVSTLTSMKGSILLSGLSHHSESSEELSSRQLADQRAAQSAPQ